MHRPGGPSQESTALISAGAQKATKGPSYKYTWSSDINSKRASTDFPLTATNATPYDDIAETKSKFAHTDMGGNWVVPFTDSDAAYTMTKRDQMEKANFDDWVWRKYDLTDPAENLMLQQIAPELYERRAELIDWNQNLVSNYAKLRLRGAKDINDLMFEWMVETGRVELPQGSIWDPQTWRKQQLGNLGGSAETDLRVQSNRYAYGLFSPLRFLTSDNSGWFRDTANPFDIRGDKNNRIGDKANDPAKYRYANPRNPQKNQARAYLGKPMNLAMNGLDEAGRIGWKAEGVPGNVNQFSTTSYTTNLD